VWYNTRAVLHVQFIYPSLCCTHDSKEVAEEMEKEVG